MNASSTPVIVGLSGGVDSSLSALLLQRQGYRVSGLFMKNWEENRAEGPCMWEEDVADALAVCDRLGIPLNTVDLTATYWREVFEDFLSEYRAGRTPNPDILCNREIKFKAFLDHALAQGADKIATGHYARIEERDGTCLLLKGRDRNKDQSYFLYALGQRALSRTLFPVGGLEKTEVRRLAREAGLPVHDKKDSTGICFIGERRFREFLARYLPASPGEILDTGGRLIGRHQGVFYYTLGQRQGLGIGGVQGAMEAPWYVLAKDIPANVIIAGQGHDHPWLFSRSLIATRLHWISGQPPVLPLRCRAKTRYRQPDQACEIQPLEGGRCRVVFAREQRAVTPGQSVVFYQDDICLGGGIIETTDSVHDADSRSGSLSETTTMRMPAR